MLGQKILHGSKFIFIMWRKFVSLRRLQVCCLLDTLSKCFVFPSLTLSHRTPGIVACTVTLTSNLA